jgi:hypothetical protein
MSNRAGLETVTGFDTSGAGAKQFLLPFEFSSEQTYQLEFTDSVFRVIRDGGYVLDSDVTPAPVTEITAAVTAEITLTNPADAADFPVGTLAFVQDPNGDHELGGVVVRVSAVSGGDLTFEVFDGSTLDTSSGWGTTGAGATLSKVYEATHPFTLSDMFELRFAQDADVIYTAHRDYAPKKIQRMADDDWTVVDVTFAPGIDPIEEDTLAITAATQTNPVVVTSNAHGLSEGDAFKITGVVGMAQLNDLVYVAGAVTANTIALKGRDGANVDGTVFGSYSSGGTIETPGAEATVSDDAVPLDLVTYKYAVAPIKTDTQEEGLPTAVFEVDNDLIFQGSINHIGWRAHADAERYNIYKQDAGAFGYIGTTTSTLFNDENITPDLARGPRVDRNPFGTAGDYPGVVSFFEQRLAYGSTNNDPQVVEMSRADNIENFGTSFPEQPDDAFRFRLRARQVNRVRAFIPHDTFAIMTSSAEWEIAAQGDGEYIRPDRRRLSPRSYFGSYDLEPVLIGGVALYLEPSGNVVRDFRMSDRSQPPGDLTILARDFFEGKFVTSWAYSRAPFGLLFVTMNTGELLTMTYIPEHDIWAWTEQRIAGTDTFVHQVSSVLESGVDTPYFVVSRTLGGQTVTLVERLAERKDLDITEAYFADGGFKASYGSDVSSVTGLLHLRGETVVALIDGDVLDEIVVDETGTADFGAKEGTDISIGLPYEAYMETLTFDVQSRERGSSRGRVRASSEVAIKVVRSRGLEAGISLEGTSPLKEWDASLIGGPIPSKTETLIFDFAGDWERDASIFVKQPNPLPMTVTMIAPEWEFGG